MRARIKTMKSKRSCAPPLDAVVLLYLPTYSPWLNPIEMLWRHYRREVTHCELFENIQALVAATLDFFQRHNTMQSTVLSIIGSKATSVI